MKRSGMELFLIGVSLLMVALVLVGVVAELLVEPSSPPAARPASLAEAPLPPPPARRLLWLGDDDAELLLADADGDGDLDVIGRSREVANDDAVMIIALDGATGATVWETPRLGSYTETQAPLALDGDLVVFATTRGQAMAFEVRGGALRWTVSLPSRVERWCGGAGEPVVGASSADDVDRRLSRADGTEQAPPEAHRDESRYPMCVALRHDRRRSGAPRRVDKRVRAGVRPGDIAQLVAIDDAWKVDIAPDPLAAQPRAPDLIASDDVQACATYLLVGSNTPHVACFALADGARRLDVPTLDDGAFDTLDLTAIGIVMTSSTHVEVRDPATGALRWTYGKP